MKSVLTRVPMIWSAAALFAATARPRELTRYATFAKSISAGTIHLVRRIFSSNVRVVASNFRQFLADESVVANIIGHFEVVRILDCSGARVLIKHLPHYAHKYGFEYMAKSFGKKSRREILKFHHQYLFEHVAESFYEQILESRPILWTETINDNCYAISISFSHQFHSEGDISLTFDSNNIPIYEISFSIVPGTLINSAAEQVLLVARVHGRSGQAEAIGIATRACQRIAPPYLLLAALQSIAAALAIDTIGGVRNNEQLARSDTLEHFFDYDAFWESFSVKQRNAGFCEIPVPFPQKPIDQSKENYRVRTRLRRRHFRKQIADCVGTAFAKNFLKANAD